MKWTQTLKMHLNGGKKFSALIHNVLCDGKPTGIMRTVRTNGSPKYIKTQDVFACGEDVFDVMANGNNGLEQWLQDHHKDA